MDPYWESIAKDIQAHQKNGHPKDWSEEIIRTFLADLEEKLISKSKKDTTIAQLCGVPYIKGRYATEHLKTITSPTFRRIFQYGESKGKPTTKNHFAIYFDYKSAEDYTNKKRLKLIVNSTNSKNYRFQGKLKVDILALGMLLVSGIIWITIKFTSSGQFNINLKNTEIKAEGDVIFGKDVRILHTDSLELLDSLDKPSTNFQKIN